MTALDRARARREYRDAVEVEHAADRAVIEALQARTAARQATRAAARRIGRPLAPLDQTVWKALAKPAR